MIPKELLRKIRRIEIRTSHLVNDALAGQYHSAFKGRGMEFEEVRQYQVGDDVRTIDWNVSARCGEPYVKVFREERELTVLFAVDLSASGDFGSVDRKKNEVAAEICALLAFSAIKNNDKVGLVVFTDTHVIELVMAKNRDLFQNENQPTEAEEAAAFRTLVGSAGTYSISGSTITAVRETSR